MSKGGAKERDEKKHQCYNAQISACPFECVPHLTSGARVQAQRTMRIRTVIVSAAALCLIAPSFAAAAFVDASAAAKAQVSALSQQQLDSLNTKVFSDAHLTAKTIGFDRSDIDQIKAELQALRSENAQFRAQATGQSVGASPASSLEARVSVLEGSFSALQGTLMTVV